MTLEGQWQLLVFGMGRGLMLSHHELELSRGVLLDEGWKLLLQL